MSRLEVDGVSVRFGGREVLRHVTLSAESGEITGLIGPNGAGKTTLFNIICGLQRPDDGRVLLDGADLSRVAPFKRARRGLARTFQRLELFGLLTARENVRLAATAQRRSGPDAIADNLLDQLGISALADVRADRLPTGQARLVELGRALATGPSVLLLDEPASGQNDGETAAFAEVLRGVAAGGIAVLLVEHDVPLVMEICSTVHVLDLGRLIASGAPAQIRADKTVLDAYLGSGAGVQ